MYKRILQINEIIEFKSVFLLGPRQTGKTTLLKDSLKEGLVLDLLFPPLFRSLSAYPESLEALIEQGRTQVVIDEIQKLPILLDVVHRLIESRPNLRFVLTGSSARKLRSGGVNLLGGRAHLHNLFPITTQELHLSGIDSWEILLERGGIPSIINSPNATEDLDAYIGLYLQEEIQSEALVRSLPDFSRFLTIAGSLNGQQVNFEKLASDVGVSSKIVRSYVKILEDTLIGDLLLPLNISTKRKAVSTPKFYFFDVGIANTLRGISRVPRGSETFGDALEHLVYLELKAQRSYRRLKHNLFFWRTQTKIEVDFVLQFKDSLVAIEVKGTEFPDTSDLKGLRAFAEDFPKARRILVCNAPLSSVNKDGIEIMTARDFFSALWKGLVHPQ